MANITVTSAPLTPAWNSLLDVLNTMGASAPSFMLIVNAFAYAGGIFFLGMGIIMMTSAANPNARGSHHAQASTFGWFWSITVGVLLFALPETMSVFGSMFFPNSDVSPLAYSNFLNGQGLAADSSCTRGGLRPLFVVFGYVAFIRGWMVLREVGMYGRQSRGDATVSRGCILLGAGIALVHMKEFLEYITSITGRNLGAGLC